MHRFEDGTGAFDQDEDYDGDFRETTDQRPKRPPQSALFLGAVEWIWGIGNDRGDWYWVSRARERPRAWRLWVHDPADRPVRYLIYFTDDRDYPNHLEAGRSMLRQVWERDGLDRFGSVIAAGALGNEGWTALADSVWGPEEADLA